MSATTLTIAALQQQTSPDRALCLEQQITAIQQAAKQGAKLIVLQELHNGYYFCQSEDPAHFAHAESIPGPTTDILAKLAKTLQVVIVASLFERRTAGLYHNTAVVLERDGHIAGIYRKMHIPEDPGFHEKFYFTPGDLGFQPIKTSIGRLGVLVCWDQWFPEAARSMVLHGAEYLIYPTAIGWDPRDTQEEKDRQLQAWVTIQRSHAIANGIPVIVCNRVGFEPSPKSAEAGIMFWGHSFIIGPQGEFLAQASTQTPEIIMAEIDSQRSESVRQIWPFLRDRRIDAYQALLTRYHSS